MIARERTAVGGDGRSRRRAALTGTSRCEPDGDHFRTAWQTALFIKGVVVMHVRLGIVAVVVAGAFGGLCSAAFAATPGWECVPATAGLPVTSGGTGSAPSCGASTTPVLAPTYVSTGVGGKPTVQFSGVNVQLLNGSGSETTLNGEGNLVIGYDPGAGPQTGSHNLVMGTIAQAYTSYGGLLAGAENTISAPKASVLGGFHNAATGIESVVTGGQLNLASAQDSQVGGGLGNTASGSESTVSGGADNFATSEASSVSGGQLNTASGISSSVSGGERNAATDTDGSILGGCSNLTGRGGNPRVSDCSFTVNGPEASTIAGGADNTAAGSTSVVSAGFRNIALGFFGTLVGGGFQNTSSGASTSVLGGANRTLTGPNSESQIGATLFAP
jgi:hypothetical protein